MKASDNPEINVSGTLYPNVAFNNPPIISPVYMASCSVALLNMRASGIIAMKLMKNIAHLLTSRWLTMKPIGTQMRRMFHQEQRTAEACSLNGIWGLGGLAELEVSLCCESLDDFLYRSE